MLSRSRVFEGGLTAFYVVIFYTYVGNKLACEMEHVFSVQDLVKSGAQGKGED